MNIIHDITGKLCACRILLNSNHVIIIHTCKYIYLPSSWSSLKLARKLEADGVEFWALLLFCCIAVLKCLVTSLSPPLSTLMSWMHSQQYACDCPSYNFANHPENQESASHFSRYFDAGLVFLRGGVAPMVNCGMMPKESQPFS